MTCSVVGGTAGPPGLLSPLRALSVACVSSCSCAVPPSFVVRGPQFMSYLTVVVQWPPPPRIRRCPTMVIRNPTICVCHLLRPFRYREPLICTEAGGKGHAQALSKFQHFLFARWRFSFVGCTELDNAILRVEAQGGGGFK